MGALGSHEMVLSDPAPAMIIQDCTTAAIVINARVWVEPRHMFAGATAVRQAVLDAFKMNKVRHASLPSHLSRSHALLSHSFTHSKTFASVRLAHSPSQVPLAVLPGIRIGTAGSAGGGGGWGGGTDDAELMAMATTLNA